MRLMLKYFGITIGEHQSISPPPGARAGGADAPRAASPGRARHAGRPLDAMTVSDVMVTAPNAGDRRRRGALKDIVRRRCCPAPYTRMPLWRGARRTSSACSTPRTTCTGAGRGARRLGLKVEALALETWFVRGTTSLRAQLKAFLTRATSPSWSTSTAR
ncbi:hypothetical protein ACRAWF_10565 [Streptomyces sp. L7]